MRNAWIIAGLVGVAFVLRQRQSRAAAQAVPAAGGETAPAAVASFLSGAGSPDMVLGAAGGYGPLRSAWG